MIAYYARTYGARRYSKTHTLDFRSPPAMFNHRGPAGLYFSSPVEYALTHRPAPHMGVVRTMDDDHTTDSPDGYDPKHKGKNVNHPRKKGSNARTGLTDADLRAKSNYGKTGNMRFRGFDVNWRIVVGGHGNDGKICTDYHGDKHTLAIMAIDTTDPERVGAAWHFYGTKISVPFEAEWLDIPPTERAVKAVWRWFKDEAIDNGFRPDDLFLLMAFKKGPPIRIVADGGTNDENLRIRLGTDDEGVDKLIWRTWDVQREEFIKSGRHDFELRDPDPDKPGAVEFAYNRNPDLCHPAVRASAIAYRTALYAYSYKNGLQLKKVDW